MLIDQKKFSQILIKHLSSSTEEIVERLEHWVETDIQEGWACFYSSELWFKTNVPPPHLNEVGRRYECEKLLNRINSNREGPQFVSAPVRKIENYRNYLDTGDCEVFGWTGRPTPVDQAVNEVATRLVLEKNRHFWFEIQRMELDLRAEALEKRKILRGPCPMVRERSTSPRRDLAITIERDVRYWCDVYGLEDIYLSEDIFVRGDRTLVSILREVAPDIDYLSDVNRRKQLIFRLKNFEIFSWLVVFDRIGYAEQGQVDFVPRLVLVRADAVSSDRPMKLAKKDILFIDPIETYYLPICEPGDLELHCLFMLHRYRRATEFYEKFVRRTLSDCSSPH